MEDFLQIVEKCAESPLDGGLYNIGSGGSTLDERIHAIVDIFLILKINLKFHTNLKSVLLCNLRLTSLKRNLN